MLVYHLLFNESNCCVISVRASPSVAEDFDSILQTNQVIKSAVQD